MTNNNTIRLLTPVSDTAKVALDESSPTLNKVTAVRFALGLLDNTKPPVEAIFAAVGKHVGEAHAAIQVKGIKKDNTCVAATGEILDSLETECAFVINGIGDWGGCTAWSVHDGVSLAKRSIPSVTVVTVTFEALARATAKGMGMPELPLHIIPDSIETLSPDELERVGKELFEALDSQVLEHMS